MNGILTVAIGVIGVYVVFALITSRIGEAISSLTNQRGTTMYEGILALIGSASADRLYAHPFIAMLGDRSTRKPSYVEPRTFTLALVDVLRETVTLPDAAGTPRTIDVASTPQILLRDLQDRVRGLPAGDPLSRSLNLLLQGATDSYEHALATIDGWFDAQMDRVSGIYRRWVGYWQAGIALVLVVAANADTLALIRQLAADATLANGLASTVATGVANPSSAQQLPELVRTLLASGVTIGWTQLPVTGQDYLAKFAGLFLTWAAVLLGAPFWFDLLKQIVPVRVTGTKPANPDAGTRDAQANTAPAPAA